MQPQNEEQQEYTAEYIYLSGSYTNPFLKVALPPPITPPLTEYKFPINRLFKLKLLSNCISIPYLFGTGLYTINR